MNLCRTSPSLKFVSGAPGVGKIVIGFGKRAGSHITIIDDVPETVRKTNKDVSIPAMKQARQEPHTKATIIGDALVVNGKRYQENNIPTKWLSNEASSDEN